MAPPDPKTLPHAKPVYKLGCRAMSRSEMIARVSGPSLMAAPTPLRALRGHLSPKKVTKVCRISKHLVLGDSVHGGSAHSLSHVALVDPHSVSASASHLSPDRRGRGKAPGFFCAQRLSRKAPFLSLRRGKGGAAKQRRIGGTTSQSRPAPICHASHISLCSVRHEPRPQRVGPFRTSRLFGLAGRRLVVVVDRDHLEAVGLAAIA